ncbi:unnamed protein product [Gulo gulo]|uniref:Uncharacterized protein n=1 Tax=Gulo gulo TaxID=48420 RepID=A0A9X9LEI0_GULGU|nr:unnamed protein product [Gulo gulo]
MSFSRDQIPQQPPCPQEQSPLVLGDRALGTGTVASVLGGHWDSPSTFACALRLPPEAGR